MLGVALRASLPFSGTWKLPARGPRMETSSDLQGRVRPRLQMDRGLLGRDCYCRKQARNGSPPETSLPSPPPALLLTLPLMREEGEQGNLTYCQPSPRLLGAWKRDDFYKSMCP